MRDCPVIINCRDRVRDLRNLVEWLEGAGHRRIVLLDNASTWLPLLEYLAASPHEVKKLPVNYGSRALWEVPGLLPKREWFVYTDPDLMPITDCPYDVIAHLRGLLDRHPGFPKAGLGLYLDDVPQDLPSLAHERQMVAPGRLLEPDAYDSLIDTTFALYRPGASFDYRAIRSGGVYRARHLPWYLRPDSLCEEDRYYLQRARTGPDGSSWREAWDAASRPVAPNPPNRAYEEKR